jgi:hypothetical protein
VRSSTIDSALNLFKSRLQCADVTLKMNINFEEGLKDLLGSVSSSANSLFHLVERILGSVKKCLIHRPVVVLRELLDFFSRNRLNMLIQLVRANSLDQVFNCTLDFLILGLKFL